MKLKNIEFIKLLPEFMQEDPANVGLSKGLDQVFRLFADYGDSLSIWTAIDRLTEEELDELAWELNITWYEKNADISVKRKLIKNNSEIQKNLGTGYAVEQVISAYFGDGEIEEWFEYGGDPGCFKIVSSNPLITQENLNKFLRILEKVKRKSAHLDGIYIGLSGKSYMRMGAGGHELEMIEARPKHGEIESWRNELLSGAAAHEIEKWTIRPIYEGGE